MKRRKNVTLSAEAAKDLNPQATAIIDMLVNSGVVEDKRITNEAIRKAQQDKDKERYKNTEILLENYRLIIWVAESIPEEMATELLIPMNDIDLLAKKLDIELALENRRVEARLNAMVKTRQLIDRVHDALTVLRTYPHGGEEMYRAIYTTYIDPAERSRDEILRILGVSGRTYYRIRAKAIRLISTRLWLGPSQEISAWLEVLSILTNL